MYITFDIFSSTYNEKHLLKKHMIRKECKTCAYFLGWNSHFHFAIENCKLGTKEKEGNSTIGIL